MGDNIEIQFRGGTPKKWHSGTMKIDDGLITVTARDGRTKSAQLGGKDSDCDAGQQPEQLIARSTSIVPAGSFGSAKY